MVRYLRRIVLTMIAVSLSIVSAPFSVSAQEATPAAECIETTPEENEALAAMYWQEAVWGEQGVIDEIVSPDEVHHWGIGGNTVGIDEFSERWGLFLEAFPDLEFSVDLVATEGDLAATLWTASGTQTGEWQGIAPTGREVIWSGINLFRFECGLIAESWGEADHLGLRAQLGATDVPAFLATPMGEAAAAGAAPAATPAATPCPTDTAESNLAVARRWTEEVWSGQNFAVLDEILAPAAIHHGGAFPDAQGPEAITEALGRQIDAFPDISLTMDMTIADDDLVVVRWSGAGTNDGAWLGMEPTGQSVDFTGINIYRISCGTIVESWSEVNALQALQELHGDAIEATPAA